MRGQRIGIALAALGFVALAALAGYWLASPYLAIHAMRQAAAARDAQAFSEHVDYPRVRESLKGQLRDRTAAWLGVGRPGSDIERAGRVLGSVLGGALTDTVVEAMVRPEFVMKVMNEAKLQDPLRTEAGSDAPRQPEVSWSLQRQGFDRVTARGTPEAAAGAAKPIGFVLERAGFARWRLTAIELPPAAAPDGQNPRP